MAEEPTEQEISILLWTMKILNTLSSITCFLVVLTYLIFKRRFPHTLVLFFALSATILPLLLLIGPMLLQFSKHDSNSEVAMGQITELLKSHSNICLAQAVGIQFFGSMMVWWFFLMAVHLYLIIVAKKVNTRNYEVIFYVLGFGSPLIQTLIPFIRKTYGHLVLWCWIEEDSYGAWEFGSFYGIMAVLSFLALIMWIRVVFSVVQYSKMVHKSPTSHAYLFRHILAVILFIGMFAVMFAHRVQSIVQPKEINFPLLYLHACLLSGQGFVGFVCFGLTKGNFIFWRDKIQGLFMYRRTNYEEITDADRYGTQ